MEVVNKKVLADKVAEENGITKKLASEVIDTLFATMTEALKDGKKVDITGLESLKLSRELQELESILRQKNRSRLLLQTFLVSKLVNL